jgi:NDP-sugar pyrophosphorylase family protein
MKPTLLILAAGMASRYGSMKQTEGFGPDGETIMDYSIFDAIAAGFGKIVFIIRKDFAETFEASFNEKLQGKIQVEYVYQEKNSFVPSNRLPEDRVKPWGTGHAILCAKDVIHEPFAVINADDFYGRESFEIASNFLSNQCNEYNYALVGYPLNKTLSDFGTVSRGVCEVNENQALISIKERTKIGRENGVLLYEDENGKHQVNENASVSMNFWCFHQTMFTKAESLFNSFLENNWTNLKSEFFIPIIAEDFIENSDNTIHVLPTNAKWFGVTYKDDAPAVKLAIDELVADHTYPNSLWRG